jgi:c-di-GMP-binding flagellar brake protein YcgR
MDNRREKERIKGHIRIGYGKTEIRVSDLTNDLSLKGTFVRTPYPLEVGTLLKIEIKYQMKPKDEPTIFYLEGRVARIQSQKDQEGMGLEFLNVSEENQKELIALINLLPSTLD